MSRGSRWYRFQQQEGGEFDIVGFSFTKEAGRAEVEKLDPMGSRSDGPAPTAFQVFAKDRPEARKLASELFGVKVAGYITPEDKRIGRMIVKAAVMREMFCPYTHEVLDMRRAVVAVTSTQSFVCTGAYWDRTGGASERVKAAVASGDVHVYDGRELFKR